MQRMYRVAQKQIFVLFQDENMSAAESSDSSDNEAADLDQEMAPKSAPSASFQKQQNSTASSASTSSTAPSNSPKMPPTTASQLNQQNQQQQQQQNQQPNQQQPSQPSNQPSILSPLMYQTPQGMMYATPSNGGVIFSLAQGDAGLAHPAQFITIPLSVMAANGQGELDLSKRK